MPAASRRGVAGWVVALIAVGAFALGAIIGAVGVGALAFLAADEAPEPATFGPGGVATIAIEDGACYSADVTTGLTDARLDSIRERVSCEARHDIEAFAVHDIPFEASASFPGEDLSFFVAESCFLAFEGFVGLDYDSSQYDFIPAAPSAAAWRGGERRVGCLLIDFEGGRMTGTAKGSKS